MRLNMSKVVCLIATATVLGCFPLTAWTQGSGSSRSSPRRATRPMTPDEFYQTFWNHLHRQEAPYTKWPVLPGKEGLRKGTSPHGDLIRTFVTNSVVHAPQAIPYGAILVTEDFAADGKTLQHITVMFRVKGRDPEHFDWYWLQYLPDGSIARTPEKEGRKATAGKVASCIECHVKANGSDLVFSNDESAPEAN